MGNRCDFPEILRGSSRVDAMVELGYWNQQSTVSCRMLTEFVEHVAGHQVDGTMSEQDLMQIMIARLSTSGSSVSEASQGKQSRKL